MWPTTEREEGMCEPTSRRSKSPSRGGGALSLRSAIGRRLVAHEGHGLVGHGHRSHHAGLVMPRLVAARQQLDVSVLEGVLERLGLARLDGDSCIAMRV